MPKKSTLNLYKLLGALVGLAIIVIGAYYGVILRFFPLEASEVSHRFELWRHGVKAVRLDSLHGYERNYCSNSGSDCQCYVLIHGLADDAMTWRKILLRPQTDWQKPTHLVAVDLPGFGKSAPPSDPSRYRVTELAKTLGLALDQVKSCAQWTVVGNSFGGWVAGWLAIQRPELARRLIFVGSSGLRAHQGVRGNNETVETFKAPSIESMKEFQRKAYFKARELPPYVWEAVVKRVGQSNTAEVEKAQKADDALETYLPSLRKPTFVFRGEADQIVPREASQEMAKLIPGAVYFEAPKCGHLPQKECPDALMKILNGMSSFGSI